MTALQIIWFALIGVLLTVYAVLDGFDLGVGFWQLSTTKDDERRAMLSSIGPFWDGNEVWLITGGGAIFAAFPHVYATVFSALYLALMLVLFSFVFRACAIDFRNRVDSLKWRKFWDASFFAGSIVPSVLFGVAAGNVLRGLNINVMMDYSGTFLNLLNPYALLTGLLSLGLFALQGATYVSKKVQGDLAARAQKWAYKAGIFSIVVFALFFVTTIVTQPHLMDNYYDGIWPFALPTAALVLLVKASRGSFAASSAAVVCVMATLAVMLFPNTVVALGNPDLNLTVANSSSSPLTLTAMLIIAAIGMPLVIGYHIWAYKLWNSRS